MPSELKLLLDSMNRQHRSAEEGPDMCKCSVCKKSMKVSEATPDYDHHDGFELPPYTIHSCPTCEDGGLIEDYFYSKEVA